VTKTRPPAARTIWIAAVPMPLPPPCTRTVPPAGNSASQNTDSCTVTKTSGTAAASASVSRSGTRITSPGSATTSSAYPPPGRSAMTRSPVFQPRTRAPTSLTSPAHSSPRIGDAPAGGG
jgi:hypothetical protein